MRWLFPQIDQCKDQKLALFHANLVLGSRMIRSDSFLKGAATKYLEAAFKMRPDDLAAMGNYAVALCWQGRRDMAKELFCRGSARAAEMFETLRVGCARQQRNIGLYEFSCPTIPYPGPEQSELTVPGGRRPVGFFESVSELPCFLTRRFFPEIAVSGQVRPLSLCSTLRRPWLALGPVLLKCHVSGRQGGSQNFLVVSGVERFFLKAKHKSLLVESALESEPAFSTIPALQNEYAFLQALSTSQHVPAVRGFVEQGDYMFLATEVLQSFEAINTFSPMQIVEAYQQLVVFVRELYDRGIVHTDIHEKNICFRGSVPVLIDFEEARLLRQGIPFETSLDVVGQNDVDNVGEFPALEVDSIKGLTCLKRLKEAF